MITIKLNYEVNKNRYFRPWLCWITIISFFAKKFAVVGYDLDKDRVNQLNQGTDKTNEISESDLKKTKAKFTSKLNDLEDCFFIVSVPTPINVHNKPDLRALKSASTDVGKIIKKGGTVVFESTVFQEQQKKYVCQ